MQKRESKKRQPTPLDFIDINSGKRNQLLTPGGMAMLHGFRLKFDPSQTEQGIFLIANDGSHHRVDIVGNNRPAKLIFMIPEDLTPGQYTLEVRTILRFCHDLRKGVLKSKLVVV